MIFWLYYSLLLILLLSGMGIQLIGLPGLWLMAAATGVYAWLTDFSLIAAGGLLTVLGLCVVAEVFEFIAGAGGAKRAGGSRRAMVMSVVGGIAGGLLLTIPLAIIGTVIGVCIGAFAGATLAQLTVAGDPAHAARVGFGAAKGTLFGILIKLTIGCVIFALVAWRALPTRAAVPLPAIAPPLNAPGTSPNALPEASFKL